MKSIFWFLSMNRILLAISSVALALVITGCMTTPTPPPSFAQNSQLNVVVSDESIPPGQALFGAYTPKESQIEYMVDGTGITNWDFAFGIVTNIGIPNPGPERAKAVFESSSERLKEVTSIIHTALDKASDNGLLPEDWNLNSSASQPASEELILNPRAIFILNADGVSSVLTFIADIRDPSGERSWVNRYSIHSEPFITLQQFKDTSEEDLIQHLQEQGSKLLSLMLKDFSGSLSPKGTREIEFKMLVAKQKGNYTLLEQTQDHVIFSISTSLVGGVGVAHGVHLMPQSLVYGISAP